MKSTEYYRLNRFLLLSFFLLIGFYSFAQLHDSGGIGAVSLSKKFNSYIKLDLEQELRFDRNFSSLKRSGTMVGGEFTILPGTLSAELDYFLFYRRATANTYEFTHRFAAGLVGTYHLGDFIFKLRTRAQSTLLDGEHPENKFNPKYVWRNRLAVEYPIANTAFTPHVSAESFTPLSGSNNAFFVRYRLIAGTKYKLNKASSLNGYLRFDQAVNVVSPTNILYIAIGYHYDL